MIWLAKRIVCLFRGHVPMSITEVRRIWKGGIARKKHYKKRKTWIECDRCGKRLADLH